MKNYKRIGLLYVSPFVLGFLAFRLYPFVASFYYSFTSFSLLTPPKFVGLSNYIEIFTDDPDFLNSMRVTLTYAFMGVPLKVGFALLLAVLLNNGLKGINIYRTVFYLPTILGGSVAISVLWRFLFMRDGLINAFLAFFRIPASDWLGDPTRSLFTITLLAVWQFGSSMVIFLAGLKQIPTSFYEAATIDGATIFQKFFKITIPMLSPVMLFNIVLQIITTMQEFTSVFVITKGGPLKSTYMYALLLYDNAFQYLKMGYASALSWVMFIVILIVTLCIFKFFSSRIYYEGGN